MITPRARRIQLPIAIMYRRPDDYDWLSAKVMNLSESGALFGPSELVPGTAVEVLVSSPIQVGSFPMGKQLCVAEVVRTANMGAVAVQFKECRFLLES